MYSAFCPRHMKFKVIFVKHWDEPGECVIDAADEDEARDIGNEMLADGSEEIEWGPMDPQGDEVEKVSEL